MGIELNQTLPALEVDLIGEQIRLVWPAWNGFMLESTTNFSTTNTWVDFVLKENLSIEDADGLDSRTCTSSPSTLSVPL